MAPALPNDPPPTMLSTLEETLDDMRDAIAESPLYESLSSTAGRTRVVCQTVWKHTSSAAWIAATSALILVIPLLYEIDKEIGPSDPPPPPSAPVEKPPQPSV